MRITDRRSCLVHHTETLKKRAYEGSVDGWSGTTSRSVANVRVAECINHLMGILVEASKPSWHSSLPSPPYLVWCSVEVAAALRPRSIRSWRRQL